MPRYARFELVFCAGLLLAACAPTAPVDAQSDARLNLVVIGEDADTDTVPRNNRVFDRVLRAIQGKMNETGFSVFDEPAITVGKLKQNRVRRTRAEIVEICRAVKEPPLDVVVIFSIWPYTRRTDFATFVSGRVDGRMLACQTGQFLGDFEQEFEEIVLPTRCSRNCILEAVGKRTKVIGRDVAQVLARQLGWLLQDKSGTPSPVVNDSGGGNLPTQFTLVFDNFTMQDMEALERYLKVFGGYRLHRPLEVSPTRQRIWYETSSGSEKLIRNLRRMLESERIESVVNFSGNTFKVEKIGLRAPRINSHDHQ